MMAKVLLRKLEIEYSNLGDNIDKDKHHNKKNERNKQFV